MFHDEEVIGELLDVLTDRIMFGELLDVLTDGIMFFFTHACPRIIHISIRHICVINQQTPYPNKRNV